MSGFSDSYPLQMLNARMCNVIYQNRGHARESRNFYDSAKYCLTSNEVGQALDGTWKRNPFGGDHWAFFVAFVDRLPHGTNVSKWFVSQIQLIDYSAARTARVRARGVRF